MQTPVSVTGSHPIEPPSTEILSASSPLTDSQYLGGLYGLLIGDAIGVPYQYKSATKIPTANDIDLRPPLNFQRTLPHVPAGTWSDEGAQALCLLASLRYCGKLDLNDFARRLINWQHVGYMAVDFENFDISAQTAKMLNQRYQQLKQGIDLNRYFLQDSAINDSHIHSSDSLMRVLPLVLWHQGNADLQELVILAHQQSWLTHPHPKAQAACALYGLWAQLIIEHHDYQSAWLQAVEHLNSIYTSLGLTQHLQELNHYLWPDNCSATPTGRGGVTDHLRSAYWAQQFESYEATIKAVIGLGGETGSRGCIAGGIAGLRVGIEGIPPSWQHGLRGKNTLYPFLPQPKTDIKDYLVFNWNF